VHEAVRQNVVEGVNRSGPIERCRRCELNGWWYDGLFVSGSGRCFFQRDGVMLESDTRLLLRSGNDVVDDTALKECVEQCPNSAMSRSECVWYCAEWVSEWVSE
jgi:hypothetical protein